MDSRREFLKKAALLSTGLAGILPDSIQKALAIDPQAGTTYLDAEHVVILMQENRSFDHAYGTLLGVRGFNDPRAIDLPSKNKVWFQTNAEGKTYGPFRLNIKDTKATWMNALPHSWDDQVDARNGGKFDKWLDSKRSGNKQYTDMPLTMGFYTREDLPFYYALADAFTICDQNFCSSLTGTTPNRLFLWTGTIRDPRDPGAIANVRNENITYSKEASWTTFPERLEDQGITWKIYQNEISLPTGMSGEEEGWLSNFTDNPIEWFSQYNVRFHPAYYTHLQQQKVNLTEKVRNLGRKLTAMSADDKDYELTQKEVEKDRERLQNIESELIRYSSEKFNALPHKHQNLHKKAFQTNSADPNYRRLESITYLDGETKREVNVPKGDVLHQFRTDVQNKKLPMVSWVVAPENFSDHPGAPWYGAWYISEVMGILTKDSEVWKKTIFILAYDENDGYFDHVPPFVPAHPDQPDSGLTSDGIDTRLEFVEAGQEASRIKSGRGGRTGPIGLGYRVPLVIASPWSRGGYVCSEVFDHTSVLQFLEGFLTHKTGKKIKEENISPWRRTVCGDLSSVFRPYKGEKINYLAPVAKEAFITSIHSTQYKKLPSDYKALTKEEIRGINSDQAPAIAPQERGVRPASSLPYELYADGIRTQNQFVLALSANNAVFGTKAAGSPFQVYQLLDEDIKVRTYTVRAGETLQDSWEGAPHLRVYGPNGFFREFLGGEQNPAIEVACRYEFQKNNQPSGNIQLVIKNTNPSSPYEILVEDKSYQARPKRLQLEKAGHKGDKLNVVLLLKNSLNWYDFSVTVNGFGSFEQRYAGRVETGKPGWSDPLMGRAVKEG